MKTQNLPPEKLFEITHHDVPTSENVSIRMLPSEVVAFDQFMRSEDDCGSRRQLICEALQFFFEQPREVRTAFRDRITAENGGVNPHRRQGGRPKGSRDRLKPVPARKFQPLGSPIPAIEPIPKAPTAPRQTIVAPKAEKASKAKQGTLKTGTSDGW